MFDLVRPGVRTGFQSKSGALKDDYMWYSPVETRTCRQIVTFTKDWIRSYFEYSSSDTVPVFVDLGSGAGKANLIALELGFPVSIGMEIDKELVSLARENFAAHRELRRSNSIGLVLRGDATNRDDICRLRDEVLSHITGRPIWVIFNKNSFGSSALEQSINSLNEIVGDYVYCYQNPVHERILERQGFNIHRKVVDSKLRKNRDWILATRTAV